MHPAAIVFIVIGSAGILYGGYQAIHTIYEWHQDWQEEKAYQEYVRLHQEKGRSIPTSLFEEEEEENDDDNVSLSIWKHRNDASELRHRNISTSQYELSEMENMISYRKDNLQKEKEILKKQEAELERRKSIVQSRGNSLLGLFDDNNQQDTFLLKDDAPFSIKKA